MFVEALGAGPRVLGRRAEVLDRVAEFIDEGRQGSRVGGEVGTRVDGGECRGCGVQHDPRAAGGAASRFVDGAGRPVMATVVLPYRGREVSARELARPVPELPQPADGPGALEIDSTGSQAGGASHPPGRGSLHSDAGCVGATHAATEDAEMRRPSRL